MFIVEESGAALCPTAMLFFSFEAKNEISRKSNYKPDKAELCR